MKVGYHDNTTPVHTPFNAPHNPSLWVACLGNTFFWGQDSRFSGIDNSFFCEDPLNLIHHGTGGFEWCGTEVEHTLRHTREGEGGGGGGGGGGGSK